MFLFYPLSLADSNLSGSPDEEPTAPVIDLVLEKSGNTSSKWGSSLLQ